MNYNIAENVPPIWQVGDVILDRYEVKRVFTGGGMGLVYRVHHRDWDVDLAVKSPRPEFLQSEQQIENFEREAETWVNLGLHPHIVSCYYVRRLGGIPRIFAEFVEGGTLSDSIRSGRLYEGTPEKTLERVIDVAIQFAWGLHYAHEKGLVHQDVKPGNVLMLPDGTAKVSDFGLADARRASKENSTVAGRAGQSILVPGSGFMTPEYASPEQLRGEHLSRKTDVWSWAVSLLELLLGELTWASGIAAPAALEDLDDGRLDRELVVLLNRCFGSRSHPRLTSFDPVIPALTSYYASHFGAYRRSAPESAELQADALNNRGVSLLDLGSRDEGIAELENALQKDPLHTEATFDFGLARWQSDFYSDLGFARVFEDLWRSKAHDWRAAYLLGRIHLQRGYVSAAVLALKQAAELDDRAEVLHFLTEARSLAANRTGTCVQTLEGHAGKVLCACLIPDGRRVVSVGDDGDMRTWDTSTGRCIRSFHSQARYGTPVAADAQGKWAVTGNDDGKLRIWDLSACACLRVFEGHQKRISSVRLSPDGCWALSGSWDGTMRLWEATTGRCAQIINTSGKGTIFSSLCSVDLTADVQWALASYPLSIWNLTTGTCVRPAFEDNPAFTNSACLSQDKTLVLCGGGVRNVVYLDLWSVATGKRLRGFGGHTGIVTAVCISTDNKWAFSGSQDKTVLVWEAATGRCMRTLDGHLDYIVSLWLSNDDRWLLSASRDKTIRLWDLSSLSTWRELPFIVCRATTAEHASGAAALFRQKEDAFKAAMATKDWALALLQAQEARSVPGYTASDEAREMWNAAGMHCARTHIRSVWKAKSWKGIAHKAHTVAASFTSVGPLALSNKGRYLALTDVATGRSIRSFKSCADEVLAACISHDSRFVACGNGRIDQYREDEDENIDEDEDIDGPLEWTAQLWDRATGERLHTLQGHTDEVMAVCIGPDNGLVASGSRDKTLRIWDIETGRCLHELRGHEDGVTEVCFSADGRRILTGSFGETPRLWDVATGKCLQALKGSAKSDWAVCLSRAVSALGRGCRVTAMGRKNETMHSHTDRS
jgi:WD40 repeat protein/serine/threonine protein kinase